MRFFRFVLAVIAVSSGAVCAQTTRPVPAVDHIVIISIDGGRPDLILRAKCPAIRSLMDRGAFTFWARTTAVSITLPSHTSMLTGVPPNKHGIMWNDDLPFSEPVYPKYPTLFEVAHAAGYSTALVSGKGKFKTLAKPGTVDFPAITDDRNDGIVTQSALSILADHQPQILFVHFPGCDVLGHAMGWGGPEQLKEFEVIDSGIGQIVAEIDKLKLTDHTVVLVTADHGGAGRNHGPDDPRSRHIPWIIAGPGIRKNYDLTLLPTLTINTEDTFATACYFFGLTPKLDVDGRAVKEILEPHELLQNADNR